MRIRRMREKDAGAVAALMRRSGFGIDDDTLEQRMKGFQYQRNHMVAVAEHHGKLLALMHIGAEPSLTCSRCARVYTLLSDPTAQPAMPPGSLIAYARQWADRHGCDVLVESDEAALANRKAL